jgi:hypothetical protein
MSSCLLCVGLYLVPSGWALLLLEGLLRQAWGCLQPWGMLSSHHHSNPHNMVDLSCGRPTVDRPHCMLLHQFRTRHAETHSPLPTLALVCCSADRLTMEPPAPFRADECTSE